MKNLLIVLLSVIMIMVLVSCNGEDKLPNPNNEKKIYHTIYIIKGEKDDVGSGYDLKFVKDYEKKTPRAS